LAVLRIVTALLFIEHGAAKLFGFPAAMGAAGEMAVAYWMMHVPGGGFFPLVNKGDAAVLFSFVFLYLVFAGPGAWSVDGLRASRRSR
jgi:putative oxidoreductase